MTITTFSLVCLIGATLGLRLNVLILFPAIGIGLFCTAIIGVGHRNPGAEIVLTMVLVTASLQVGYLAGVVMRTIVACSVAPEIIHVFLAASQRTRRG
jgi:hypothetical protein